MYRYLSLLFPILLYISPLAASPAADSLHAATARPLAYSGFQGGMMFHLGYGFSGEYSLYDADGVSLGNFRHSGVPTGVGGALKVNFGRHLRIGGEGYVSTMKFGGNGSYARIGWGGLLADSKWDVGKWTFFVGGMIGGGSQKTLNIINDPHSEYQVSRSSYRRFSFFALSPFAGVEFALTQKIHLILKTDYLFNVTARRPDFISGPRLYFGIMFCH